MQKYLLSIGVTSYNRISELKRCLESIDSIYIEKIEIIISEDKSPKKDQITNIVEEFIKTSKYKVVYNSNEKNLGYDRNLKKLISLATGKYILYISDDDMFLPKQLDKILKFLEKEPKGVIYSPFYQKDIKEFRRYYKSNRVIQKGEKYVGEHIYDSILFSGLIFQRDIIKDIDAERFLNKIYFQVYLYLYCGHFYGGYYINEPLIICVSDGENGFGLSESSNNSLLAKKGTPLANLEYIDCLIEVIKMFDKDYNTNYFKFFEREYNLRSAIFLKKAREIGKEELRLYWQRTKKMNLKINWISRIYYYMFLLLGANISEQILRIPKRILIYFRGEKQK